MMAMPIGPQPSTKASRPADVRLVDGVQPHRHRFGQGGMLGSRPLGTGSSSGAESSIRSA